MMTSRINAHALVDGIAAATERNSTNALAVAADGGNARRNEQVVSCNSRL